MLVLGRAERERLYLEVLPSDQVTRIVVEVVKVKTGRLVNLGIEAPRSVVVTREPNNPKEGTQQDARDQRASTDEDPQPGGPVRP